jgi:hypothetical protein
MKVAFAMPWYQGTASSRTIEWPKIRASAPARPLRSGLQTAEKTPKHNRPPMNTNKRRWKTKKLHLSYRRCSAFIGGEIAFFSILLKPSLDMRSGGTPQSSRALIRSMSRTPREGGGCILQ